MKHNIIASANAVSATTSIIFVVCRLLVSLAPDFMFSIAQSWFHGIEFTKSASIDGSIGTFILGLVSATITAWVITFLFMALRNRFSEK